jgi:hypothetical protein
MFNFFKTASFGAIAIAVLVSPVFASAAAITATGDGPNAIWDGSTSSSEFDDLCSFIGNDAGVMVLTNNVWTITTPAVVTLKTRGVDNITVVSDEKIRLTSTDVAVDDVTVSYSGSSVNNGPPSINGQSSTNLYNVTGVKAPGASVFNINIAGTASLVNTNAMANGENYYVKHLVTCLQ